VRDLSPYIDRPAKRVTSETGELVWDWGAGLVAIDAPAAQGATGFLGAAGNIELNGVEIETPLDYGSVVLVAMDGKPIVESGKLLLQVVSEEKPWQWETDSATGLRSITNRGTVPLMVKELAGTIRLKRSDAATLTVTPLDANGYRVGAPADGAAEITLLPDRLYYLIER
jgi:hypothetical protein